MIVHTYYESYFEPWIPTPFKLRILNMQKPMTKIATIKIYMYMHHIYKHLYARLFILKQLTNVCY